MMRSQVKLSLKVFNIVLSFPWILLFLQKVKQYLPVKFVSFSSHSHEDEHFLEVNRHVTFSWTVGCNQSPFVSIEF